MTTFGDGIIDAGLTGEGGGGAVTVAVIGAGTPAGEGGGGSGAGEESKVLGVGDVGNCGAEGAAVAFVFGDGGKVGEDTT